MRRESPGAGLGDLKFSLSFAKPNFIKSRMATQHEKRQILHNEIAQKSTGATVHFKNEAIGLEAASSAAVLHAITATTAPNKQGFVTSPKYTKATDRIAGKV
mmetsp:Transcript_6947/g.16357  ORF Transcript_6947/g.16357 Transcript_6947/m.16357 type:complete len:102 (+) Transcript_6947:1355-1660(+)